MCIFNLTKQFEGQKKEKFTTLRERKLISKKRRSKMYLPRILENRKKANLLFKFVVGEISSV